MNPTVAGYLGFVVAALIIIWAVFEIGRRYTRRKNIDAQTLSSWVKLDSTHTNVSEELHPIDDDDTSDDGGQEDIPESNLHTRAQQNGHYSESKKPL